MTLYEFADIVMKDLEISRSYGCVEAEARGRFFASFANCEVKEPGVLVSIYGRRPTPEKALTDYARRIAGQTLVFDAYTNCRAEFKAPETWDAL
jgi:hypothetical protein